MSVNIKQVCNLWGVSNVNELYIYAVESYFNGQLKQAKKIVSDINRVSVMNENYIEEFIKNLHEWFNTDTAEIIINSIIENKK